MLGESEQWPSLFFYCHIRFMLYKPRWGNPSQDTSTQPMQGNKKWREMAKFCLKLEYGFVGGNPYGVFYSDGESIQFLLPFKKNHEKKACIFQKQAISDGPRYTQRRNPPRLSLVYTATKQKNDESSPMMS